MGRVVSETELVEIAAAERARRQDDRVCQRLL